MGSSGLDAAEGCLRAQESKTALDASPRNRHAQPRPFRRACAVAAAGAVRCWGLSSSGDETCVLTAAGGVRCWGDLGDDLDANASGYDLVPVTIPGLSSGVHAISAAGYACAVPAAGGVVCWGLDGNGQLGDGTTDDSPIPVTVLGL